MKKEKRFYELRNKGVIIKRDKKTMYLRESDFDKNEMKKVKRIAKDRNFKIQLLFDDKTF